MDIWNPQIEDKMPTIKQEVFTLTVTPTSKTPAVFRDVTIEQIVANAQEKVFETLLDAIKLSKQLISNLYVSVHINKTEREVELVRSGEAV